MAIVKRGRKWVCVVYIGRSDGKQHRRWRTFGTRSEAKAYEAQLRLDGVPLAPSRLTVAEYARSWIDTIRPVGDVTATWLRYASAVRRHIIPALGPIKLANLGPAAIEDWIKSQQRRGYAKGTTHLNLRVLSTMLRRAIRHRLITTNPVTLVDRPQPDPSATAHWDSEAIRMFLGELQRSPLGSLFAVAVATGARSCEIRALREEDYDPPLVHFRQKVRRVPGRPTGHWVFEPALKTKHSRRTVTLPPFALTAIATQITGRGGLLWHREDGEPLAHYEVQSELDRIAKAAGIPRLTLHGLRHTQATVLAHAGVAPQIIQRRLGHSRITTTMDIYSHEMPGEDAPAAEILERIVREVSKG